MMRSSGLRLGDHTGGVYFATRGLPTYRALSARISSHLSRALHAYVAVAHNMHGVLGASV